jgi:aminoglycoside phosphotransferase (APT) family kinase protein
MDPAVETALTDAFPGRDVATVTDQPGSEHPGNRTVRVEFADGGMAYLKVAVDGDRERIARDAAAMRYAGAHADVRVPAVLAAGSEADPPYVATAPLAGTPIADSWSAADAEERARLLRAVGHGLAGVHAAGFDGPGRIVGGDTARLDLAAADDGSWTEVLCATVEDRARTLFADRFEELPGRVVDALRERRDSLDDAPAALVHDDPRPENCFLVDTGAGSADCDPGFIDWETALVGDPALDVCRAEAGFVDLPEIPAADRERLRGALHEGYRDRAGDLPAGFENRRPVYEAVTFLRTARTFDLWAPEATEPVDDLAGWVRAEMARRLDRR